MSQQPPKHEITLHEFRMELEHQTGKNLSQWIRQNWQLLGNILPEVQFPGIGPFYLKLLEDEEKVKLFEILARRVEESALSAVRQDLAEVKNMLTVLWRNSGNKEPFPPSSEK